MEYAATLPPGFAIAARPTSQAVAEMVNGAMREVVALGYEISDDLFLRQLVAAAGRAVDVTLICDRERATGRRILDSWPDGVPPPGVYQNRPRENAGPYASMHSKSVLVDGRDLLLTSANLTFHGLNENVEFGVRLRGKIAAEAR